MSKPDSRSDVEIEPGLDDEVRLETEAMADYAAGRVVPHADVAAWLDSWGTSNELPCPNPKAR